ncbi:hypothetical protein VNO77_49522 [Canavalia gladiata]|uniref:Uncharacterized protein n=1 Tax=Canavalia gladiata TaxID=3824 RepID=A0AAN9PFR2_CANGL
MPTRNPADKAHYIVRFRDWRLTHSMTLAPDVPKMGAVLSGRDKPPRGSLCFGTKQFELGSVNWNVYYRYRGSFN